MLGIDRSGSRRGGGPVSDGGEIGVVCVALLRVSGFACSPVKRSFTVERARNNQVRAVDGWHCIMRAISSVE